MTDFYTEMQGVAKSLLAEFQQGPVAYVQITPGAGRSDDPGPATETRHPLTATVRGVSYAYILKGSAVKSDLQLTMPGGGVVPKINGFIELGAGAGLTRYKIVEVDPKPATGIVAAYTVIFRK